MIIKDIPNRYAMLIILGMCVFHFLFLLRFFAPAISTPDAQGYFTQGRIIATHGQTFLYRRIISNILDLTGILQMERNISLPFHLDFPF